MKTKRIILLLILISQVVFSQEKEVKKESNKGKLFFYWGWNVADYSNSDIHFKGENYDFTLYDVSAKDRPTPFGFDPYFHPLKITIPQTNVRIGYFFHDNYTISVGVDHMKYVMNQYQKVKINGTINTGSSYDNVYTNNDEVLLTHDFLQFEHTDGLNYVNAELKRFDEIGHLIGMTSKDFTLSITEGVGAGILFPRTNTKLLGGERHDDFHVSGWGVSVGAGLNLTFLKYFFIQSDLKWGYINMQDIKTSLNSVDSASQKFTFFEKTIVFGARFNILNKK